jgi:hypothetical protein
VRADRAYERNDLRLRVACILGDGRTANHHCCQLSIVSMHTKLEVVIRPIQADDELILRGCPV